MINVSNLLKGKGQAIVAWVLVCALVFPLAGCGTARADEPQPAPSAPQTWAASGKFDGFPPPNYTTNTISLSFDGEEVRGTASIRWSSPNPLTAEGARRIYRSFS
jgi:hypothetical protein